MNGSATDAETGKRERDAGGIVLPSREEVEELLTEPSEVTRWGIALASIGVALIAGLLDHAVR